MLPDGSDPVLMSTIARIKAILMTPRTEWPVIAQERTPGGEVFTRYVMPLAAIGPVCAWLGRGLYSVGGMILSYLLALGGVLLMTFVVDLLAPKFGGQASRADAFRLVAYAGTAGWLAGVFGLIPALGILGLIGLYSLYLFYLGTGPMLKIPADKQLVFTVVVVLCLMAFGVVVSAVFGSLLFGMGGL